jgi:hypothetical protein
MSAITIEIDGLEPRLAAIENELRELRGATLSKDQIGALKIGLTYVLTELRKITGGTK